ncbi:MAG TPA: M20/M25/M40 family metallo-hydrolase [Candidatus Acidoferrales bacterium]|nr:M20/M25/M40 family metallo-hydrolase [Candidatus Acidoferrales bacterium]
MPFCLGRLVLMALILMGVARQGWAQEQPAKPELARLSDEAVAWLTDLIRINTTNPPGNELPAAKYIASILEKEGITAEVLESASGRGVVIARLRSSAVPDPSRALLLLGHLDVVGVQKEKWSVDPFGGVTKDGYLYGRGAIDDKGMVIANLAVLVALKRASVRLSRDVIFLAEGDEEQGGEFGIEFVIDKYWNKIAAGFALNEGGAVRVKDSKVQYVGVQASEKVPLNVTVVATGPSGHGSRPRPDNPVVHLAAAVAKIGNYVAPARPNVVVRRYFEQLAKVEDPETSKWMRALETPERMEHAARVLSEASPAWSSMLRNSVAPTMLRAGIRSNVVPSEARANLNIRLLPGERVEPLLLELTRLVNDPQIRFELESSLRPPAPPSSIETELYQTIERVGPTVFPSAVVVPYMDTGATDSAQLRMRRVEAYGLFPFPLTEADELRMHADDERIPLDSFRKGVEFLYRVVEEFARAK